MKKIVLSAIILLAIGSEAVAEEWKFFPVKESGYSPDYAVAPIWGSYQFDKSENSSGDMFGVELSLNCPLVKPSNHDVRQQVSLTSYDHSGDTLVTLALNPHYMFPFSDNFQLGVGPSFQMGYIDSDSTAKDIFYGVGFGGSLRKDFTERIFFGIEINHTWLNAGDFDNFRAIGKVGYKFTPTSMDSL